MAIKKKDPIKLYHESLKPQSAHVDMSTRLKQMGVPYRIIKKCNNIQLGIVQP